MTKKFALALLGMFVLALLAPVAAFSVEGNNAPEDHVLRAGLNNLKRLAPGQFQAAAVCDTAWYGFVQGGSASTTGYGGVWDFDRKPTGVILASASDPDAMQGWSAHLTPYLSGGSRAAATRPEWFLNYGNHGRYWKAKRVQDIPDRSGALTNTSISGNASLWCGLDKVEASTMQHNYRGSGGCGVNYPGYGDLWDQYVFRDFTAGAVNTQIIWTYKTDGDVRPEEVNAPMMHVSMYDALSIWVGNVTAGVPHGAIVTDPEKDINDLLANNANRLNLSKTLSATGGACTQLDCKGYKGLVGATTDTTGSFAVGSAFRVVFRVRTNRIRSDQTSTVSYDGATTNQGSNYGLAVIDDVYLTGGAVANPVAGATGNGIANKFTFETGANGDLQGWQVVAKTLPQWSHILNVGNNSPTVNGLLYDVSAPDVKWADACGVPGSVTSLCNLKNNTLAQFDPTGTGSDPNRPRDHYSIGNWPNPNGENQQAAYSPKFAFLTSNGCAQNDVTKTGMVIDCDLYAYLPVDEAVFVWTWVRFNRNTQNALPCTPRMSYWERDPVIYNVDVAGCFGFTLEQSQLIANLTTVDTMQIMLGSPALCYAFGAGTGTCHGNFTPLWDNVRAGKWNSADAPPIIIFDWQFWQDAFPVENTAPGGAVKYLPMQKRWVDASWNGTRENTTPYVKTKTGAALDVYTAVAVPALNNMARPYTDNGNGTNPADSVAIQTSLSTRGTRMDCVFRVLPGPTTATSDQWFQAFIANTGQFGNPASGTHPGGTWKWWVWNSVRMDTAENDGWDTTASANATPATNYLSSTVHESDPHYGDNTAGGSNIGILHCMPKIDPAPAALGAWLANCSGQPSTTEHTPIFPSYVFKPGTVISYFYRSAFNDNLSNPRIVPDTNVVNSLGSKYFLWRILPDAWKDPSYGVNPCTGKVGTGRACALFDDHSFPLSQVYFAYHNAFDSLGIVVDDYTSQAPSSGEPGGIGNAVGNLANATFSGYGSAGPSVNNLITYSVVYYNCNNLGTSSLADGQRDGDANADVQLFDAWLKNGAGDRGLWLNGALLAGNLNLARPSGGPSRLFCSNTLGVIDGGVDNGLSTNNYRVLSGDNSDCPTILAGTNPAWSSLQKTAVNGNFCLINYDVIPARTDILTSATSQVYNVGGYGAGVTNKVTTLGLGTSKTLIDALEFNRVRNESCHDSYGRIYQMRTVSFKHFTKGSGAPYCAGTFSQVGTPEVSRPTVLFQNSPNPFRPNRATAIRYMVGRKAPVSLMVMDVTGRTVRTLVSSLKESGDYTANFDGRNDAGDALPAGVYFSRLKVGDFESNKKMLMLK